ncbi:MAG: hypothetical protein MUO21_03005 [Nitrososphaeraceae archaeon]|nr:hypothetical protein [Nitrososphaeraceae archaeon]
MGKKLSRKERLDLVQEAFDKIITPDVLTEAMELHKQLTRSHPDDYWRKLR